MCLSFSFRFFPPGREWTVVFHLFSIGQQNRNITFCATKASLARHYQYVHPVTCQKFLVWGTEFFCGCVCVSCSFTVTVTVNYVVLCVVRLVTVNIPKKGKNVKQNGNHEKSSKVCHAFLHCVSTLLKRSPLLLSLPSHHAENHRRPMSHLYRLQWQFDRRYHRKPRRSPSPSHKQNQQTNHTIQKRDYFSHHEA